MLQDSQIRILLTQEQLAPTLATYVESVICLDTGWPLIAEESKAEPNIDVALGNLIYVFYTSGSTGKPKGVAMAHRSSSNLIQWQIAAAGIQPGSKTLQFTSLSFGVSFQEIFATLCGGGTLYLVDEAVRKDAFSLYELINSFEVERLFVPFVALQQIAEVGAGLDDKHSTLRWIFTAGEQLKVTPALEKFFSNSPGCVLENQYGATETHVVTSFRLSGPPKEWVPLPPVGGPISNSQVYVLDDDGKPVPVGVGGDLYLAGEGIARGYLNRPELTAEKFIPDALGTQPGGRLYRTGDRARRKEDGSLELLGRADHQVKIRGYRIELGEIESVLLEHPEVRQAALLCVEGQGEKQLIAYVVQREGANLTTTELGAHLRRTLPEHAVPSAWSFLEKLPLLPSGKLDRGSLPAIELTQSVAHGDPRNETEQILSKIWGQTLGRSRVGIHDNFFDLGGYSILAVRTIVAVRNHFQCNILLQSLFRYPTIAEFVQALPQVETGLAPTRLVEIQSQGARHPIFFVHPVGGTVLCYSDLARALGADQPFYGLQSPLTDVDQLETIEQMASAYNLEIKKIQKRGPYLLGGWSVGGLVAFEMARQLYEEGEITRMLVLVDSHLFQTAAEGQSDRSLMIGRFAANMARTVGVNISQLETKFLKLQPEEQWAFLLKALIAENVLAIETAEAELTGMFRVFVRNLSAANRYQIQPTGQRIVLLAAEDGLDPRKNADEWASRTGSDVEFHLIPGNHYTMMRPPNVQALAACLQRCLDSYENGLARASDMPQSTITQST
jgi:amino acid adenylation domain-containing protein